MEKTGFQGRVSLFYSRVSVYPCRRGECFCTAGRFGQHYGKSASDSGCDGERAEVGEQNLLRSSGTTSGKRHDG